MLRTILILATLSLLSSVCYAQTKIGDDVLNIDDASILELESTSRGFLPSRMTSAQRDAQSSWNQAHIIFNTTEDCLQIFSGTIWECLRQGTPIDSTIYKYNGTLRSNRTVTMNNSDLTFDGSTDTIIITADGRLGIGDSTPDALLDVEGGTVRLSDYGTGVNSGQRTFLLGVDMDGDVITVDTSSVGTDDQTIDALFIRNDTLFISLEDDGVSDLYVNIAPYLDADTDWLALGGSPADNIEDTIYTLGRVGIGTETPVATLHIVEEEGTFAGPWAIIEGGGGVLTNTSLQLYDRGTDVGNQNVIQFAHNVSGTATPLATIRSNTNGTSHANGADLILESSSDGAGTLNTNQLYLNNDGNVGIGTSTPDEELHIDGDMRLDGSFEDKDGDAGSSGDVLTSTVSGTDWVNAATIGTDNQIIDFFNINIFNELELSLEGDAEDPHKVDLSGYLDDQTVTLTGVGINAVTGTYPNFTITGTEVDGSVTNEAITAFSYTSSSGQLTVTENGTDFDATIPLMTAATSGSAGVRGLVPNAAAGQQDFLLTGAGTWLDPSTLTTTNIYTDNGTLDANRTVGLSTFDLIFDGSSDIVFQNDGDVGIGTVPTSRLDVESQDNEDAFRFVQTDGLTGEKDVFTIEDQDVGGGGQDESSVLKVLKSGSINAGDLGFSLIELANTSTDPGDSKYWISGRKTDEGAPLWGVDITDNDYWSEGGIILGVTGANDGTYSGGTFIVEADGDVGIGTTTPGARLEVDGGSVIFDEYGVGTYADASADYILATNIDGEVVELNTAKNTRWFYPPAVVIDASAIVKDTIDLYTDYRDQFSTPLVSNPEADGFVPYYDKDQLDYYITYYDDNVLDNITIDADGIMIFDVIAVPFDNYTVINVVFVIKDP